MKTIRVNKQREREALKGVKRDLSTKKDRRERSKPAKKKNSVHEKGIRDVSVKGKGKIRDKK